MRAINSSVRTFVRGIRRQKHQPRPPLSKEELETRLNASTSYEAFGPMKTQQKKPATWLANATTYADKNTVIMDSITELPYDPEDVNLQPTSKKKQNEELEKRKRKKQHQVDIRRINFDIPLEEQVVILFPGQGSHHVGMGKKVIDHKPSKLIFDKASEILGYDLYDVCTNGPQEKLDQTIYCQPAVFVASIAAMEKLNAEENLENRITDVAGFSVGELTALVVAGVLDFEGAVRLVKLRAEAMHECNQIAASGMLTIRTTAASQLKNALLDAKQAAKQADEAPICEIANYLTTGVNVIGGSNFCLDFLEKNADEYKIQIVKRLKVSGAFHTILMSTVEEKLSQFLYWKGKEKFTRYHVTFNWPRYTVYSNFQGKPYPGFGKRGDYEKLQFPEWIIKQVSAPVKWMQIQQELLDNVIANQPETKKRLRVSGAFHTILMEKAGKKLEEALKVQHLFNIAKPCINVYSNYTGFIYPQKPSLIYKNLIKQVFSPVKWLQIQQHLFHRKKKVGYEEIFPSYIEVGPGRQLGAMLSMTNKKMYKRYRNYSC